MSRLSQLRSALRDRLGPGSVSGIGLEIGSQGLHLLQLSREGESLGIRAARFAAFPDDREALLASPPRFKAWLRAALGSRPFVGRRVVAALGGSEVKLMVLGYEHRPGRDEPRAILELVRERVSEPLSDLVVDYIPIRGLDAGSTERSALVAVARQTAVIEHLERLRLAGLEVVALEIVPVAIRRLVSAVGVVGEQGNALALYAGESRSHMIVLWGRRLVLYREVDFSESALVEAVGKALETKQEEARTLLRRYGVHPPGPDEAARPDPGGHLEVAETLMEILKPSFYGLAEEVQRAKVYTASKSRGAAPDEVLLLGAFTSWPGSARLLESLIAMPVRSLDPVHGFAVGPDAASEADLAPGAELALSVGLALRGWTPDG